ncbi:hypothetical protein QW131_06060 [Roseibium salinum]|nr:hypothetical protein [Roseibium salinum]
MPFFDRGDVVAFAARLSRQKPRAPGRVDLQRPGEAFREVLRKGHLRRADDIAVGLDENHVADRLELLVAAVEDDLMGLDGVSVIIDLNVAGRDDQVPVEVIGDLAGFQDQICIRIELPCKVGTDILGMDGSNDAMTKGCRYGKYACRRQ